MQAKYYSNHRQDLSGATTVRGMLVFFFFFFFGLGVLFLSEDFRINIARSRQSMLSLGDGFTG